MESKINNKIVVSCRFEIFYIFIYFLSGALNCVYDMQPVEVFVTS